MPGRGLALAAGLAAMLVALAAVLSGAPPSVAGSNGVAAEQRATYLQHVVSIERVATYLQHGGPLGCQPAGTLPAGTDAIRESLSANVGPSVRVRVLEGSRTLSEGSRPAGWGAADTVTVPVSRVASTSEEAQVCTSVGATVETVQVDGRLSPRASGPPAIRMRLEYLRPGSGSWLSRVASIARDMGLGHAPSGSSWAYVVIACMLLVAALACRLVLRGGPRAAWLCALVAVLSAACWSLVTPPFEAIDEPPHFAYAQLLAETGRLPSETAGYFSPEEELALLGLRQHDVQLRPEQHTVSTPAQVRELHEDLSTGLSRVGSGAAGDAASGPPGYYALEALPYYLGAGGTLLDRLELMRLLSALMAGASALFAFLFVRESLPGAPWAWTVGGLGAALAPLLGYTSGAVTPDAMLCAVCATLFYCLARAFRRGLTPRLALLAGLLTAVGLLTKLTFVGLVPGVLIGLLAAAVRDARRHAAGERPDLGRVVRVLAPALALALSPALVYALSNLLEGHRTLGLASLALQELGGRSPLAAISYTWQMFLPRLPGTFSYFPGVSPLRQLWLARAVGDYGWLDTPFPVWADELALVPATLIAGLGVSAALARRAALRVRLPEILTYAAMAAGLTLLIGADGYNARAIEGAAYFQPRYLLPLLPLAGAWLALAARGAGRRWGPAVGALIVVLILAQDVFSQLQVVARYYG
jgi:hypothetical protein